MTSCQKRGYIYPLAHHKRREEKGSKGDSALAWHNVVIVKIDFKMNVLSKLIFVDFALKIFWQVSTVWNIHKLKHVRILIR